MAGLPPLAPAPGAFPSPSPSNLCLKATSKAGDGQPQPMPATMASKDGGEPQHDTDGVGRVGGQGIYGGEPPTRTDGGGDITMRTDAAGGKRPQTPQAKNDSLVKKRKKHNDPTTIKAPRKSASTAIRSPMQATSSPGVNFLLKSAAVNRASMAGSPKTPQPPSCSPSLHDLSPDTRATNSQASKRKHRKLISDIWKEAEPIYKDGKLVEGKCNHCHEIFAASRDTGTSHMKRHLKVCEAKNAMSDMVAKMGRPDVLDPNWKFNPKLARRKLLKMIVINELPFSFVEYTPFREFTAALNPWFENISRTTITNDCVDAFEYHGDEMKMRFKDSVSRISLTGDMWTSNQKLGYFCLTCHFVSDAWILHKYIIRFAMLETPHNSVNMFNLVLNSLKEWNLEDKLFSFTLDNAAVNTAMINTLRKNLKTKGFLVLGGKLFHFRCATHVFNLIVQDGLKVIRNVVNSIRESVKYVGSSQARVEKFVGIIMQEGLPARSPCPDVSSISRRNRSFFAGDGGAC